MLKAIGKTVVVELEELDEATENGIIINFGDEVSQNTGTVVSTGLEDIKVGDKVMFNKYGATEIELEGKRYCSVKEEELLAKVI